jgi:hypothetical protein
MFWTRVEGIGSLGMPSILSYLHVANFMKNFPTKGFFIALMKRKQMCLILNWTSLILHMKHQVLKVLLSFFFFFILLIKKKKHVNFYVGSQV